MAISERTKWLIVGVLAVILIGVVWYQVNRADEPPAALLTPRQAVVRKARVRSAEPIPAVSIEPPESLAPLLARNPFDNPKLVASTAQDEPQAEPEPVDPINLVPEWLRTGRIEAVINRNDERIAIIAGRTVREGQQIGGVEVVRITEREIVLRPIETPAASPAQSGNEPGKASGRDNAHEN